MKFLDTYGIIDELSPILGEFTDERDGRKYQTITIKGVEWFRENLDYDDSDFYGEGSGIVVSMFDLPSTSSNHHRAGCARLYSSIAAKEACPSGWEIPSKKDWRDLMELILMGNLPENSTDLSKKEMFRLTSKLFGKNSLLDLKSCGHKDKSDILHYDHATGEYFVRDNNGELIVFSFRSNRDYRYLYKEESPDGKYSIRPIRKKR